MNLSLPSPTDSFWNTLRSKKNQRCIWNRVVLGGVISSICVFACAFICSLPRYSCRYILSLEPKMLLCTNSTCHYPLHVHIWSKQWIAYSWFSMVFNFSKDIKKRLSAYIFLLCNFCRKPNFSYLKLASLVGLCWGKYTDRGKCRLSRAYFKPIWCARKSFKKKKKKKRALACWSSKSFQHCDWNMLCHTSLDQVLPNKPQCAVIHKVVTRAHSMAQLSWEYTH